MIFNPINYTDMTEKELDLMKQASAEIKRQRNQNYTQGLRLKMFDDMMLLLHTSPPGQGMCASNSNDIVNQLDFAIMVAEDEAK